MIKFIKGGYQNPLKKTLITNKKQTDGKPDSRRKKENS